jgi:two-component system, chemotaxis family, chemotaxis protein CheY
MKILICDDSKAMRMIVKRTLRQAGFGDHEVLEAEDGAQGLAVAQAEAPDLILSDWNMPNMSGIEFLKAFRAAGGATNFGFVTSESSAVMRGEASGAGALFLITKPFTAETFQAELSSLLS